MPKILHGESSSLEEVSTHLLSYPSATADGTNLIQVQF